MRNFRKNWISAALLMLSGAVSGCAKQDAELLNRDLPTTLAYPSTVYPYVKLDAWWSGFNDPELNTIMGQALNQNLNIKQTRELLLAVYAINNVDEKRYLPHINAGVHPAQSASAEKNYLHASADVSWELSLYGQSENLRKLSQGNILSIESQLQASRVSVEAEVVFNYLRYVYANEQLKGLEEQIQLQNDNVQLERIRTAAHMSSGLDVVQSKMHSDTLLGEKIEIIEVREQALKSLRLLSNNDSLEVKHWNDNALLSDFRIESIPADLLRTRPDIKLQESNVLKAAAELGLAKADLYPRLSLLGSMTYSYDITGTARNSTNRPFGISPVIDIPLWDWGQRESNRVAQEHRLHAALLAYRESIITGFNEVNTTLSALAYQEERMKLSQSKLKNATTTLNMITEASYAGVASRYDVNKAKMTLLRSNASETETAFQRCMKIIDLYKALGGAPLKNERSESNKFTGGNYDIASAKDINP